MRFHPVGRALAADRAAACGPRQVAPQRRRVYLDDRHLVAVAVARSGMTKGRRDLLVVGRGLLGGGTQFGYATSEGGGGLVGAAGEPLLPPGDLLGGVLLAEELVRDVLRGVLLLDLG